MLCSELESLITLSTGENCAKGFSCSTITQKGAVGVNNPNFKFTGV